MEQVEASHLNQQLGLHQHHEENAKACELHGGDKHTVEKKDTLGGSLEQQKRESDDKTEGAIAYLKQQFNNQPNTLKDLQNMLLLVTAKGPRWERTQSSPIVVDVLDVSDMPDKLFRISFEVAVSAADVFRLITDLELRKKWDQGYKEIRLIRKDPRALNDLVHMVSKSPFPFNDRDYVQWRGKLENADRNIRLTVYRNAGLEEVEATTDGCVRADTIYSGVLVQQVQQRQDKKGCWSRLTLVSLLDIKGYISPSHLYKLTTSGMQDWAEKLVQASVDLASELQK